MSRPPRTEMLLALACAAAAGALGASQFMDLFHLTPPGGEALESVSSRDQHGYALVVLAAFALLALIAALWTGSQIAYFAVAAAGVVALLIFLIGDLPDVNKIGAIDDVRESFIDAKAEPQAGFWLELVGSLVLAVSGIALAMIQGSEPASSESPGDQGKARIPEADPIQERDPLAR